MSDVAGLSRSERLDRALQALLSQTPEIEAAAVVSFDGLPMASALPPSMDEDRVAAMSAALLSLGERAAQGLGRGELSQVYVEGDSGTVFLVSAEDEAVLVAVAARGAKAGLMLFEVRRAAAAVADVLRAEEAAYVSVPTQPGPGEPAGGPVDTEPVTAYEAPSYAGPSYGADSYETPSPAAPSLEAPSCASPAASYQPPAPSLTAGAASYSAVEQAPAATWTPSYAGGTSSVLGALPSTWS